VVIRYLYVEGIAVAPDEAHAKLIIDPKLCWPSRSLCNASSLLPGGIRKSSNFPAEWTIASFFLAALPKFAGGIPWLLPVSQNSFVLLSAKVLITVASLMRVVNNVKH
jgi:hypothetical protein